MNDLMDDLDVDDLANSPKPADNQDVESLKKKILELEKECLELHRENRALKKTKD